MDKSNQAIGIAVIVLAIVITLLLVGLEGASEINKVEANQYSIENVFQHIENIAKVSRPVGTEAHRKTRDYLENNLKALGITPGTQATIAVSSRLGTPVRAAYVSNIIGRIKGSGNGDIILLVAHYDSVPTSYGAGDDASSVASILETLRILKNDPQGENDIVVLFSDAEEPGLLGAKAFVDETPWLKNIKAVINLEARGSSGASLLFETSEDNSELIKSYSAAVSHPVASSFFSDIYKILPNDTDFSEFKSKNIRGLNTAFIEEINNYHTQADNVKNLNRNSVGHQGENLLAIVRDLRNKNLTESTSGNLIFFDLFGKKLVHYSSSLVLPLMIGAILLYLAAVYFGRKNGKLSLKGIIIGFLLFLFYLFSAVLLAVVILQIISIFHRDYNMFITGDTYNSVYYIYGISSLIIALTFVFNRLLGKKRSRDDLFFGVISFWILLTILTSLFLPGTSYLFSLSSISVSAASLVGFLWKDKTSADLKNFLIPVLGSFTAIILVGGIIRHLIEGLGLGMIPVGVFFISMVTGLLIYAVLILERKIRLLTGCFFAVCGIILIVLGLANVKYSPEQPRQTSLFWALNADTKQSFWATADPGLNEWNKKIFEENAAEKLLPEIFPQSQRIFRVRETQPLDLPLPSLEKISDEPSGDMRAIKFNV